MNVVIIDDSEADRFIARRLLQREFPGSTVHEFSEANAAVSTIRRRRRDEPFIVLLDINMPRMTGFEMLERMNAELARLPVAVFMLTSSAASIDRSTAEKYDCVRGYIQKPLTRARLRALISELDRSA